jgi:hypothetical protein
MADGRFKSGHERSNSQYPDAGWHATIYGRQPAEVVRRCQAMADTIAAELCRHYEFDE